MALTNGGGGRSPLAYVSEAALRRLGLSSPREGLIFCLFVCFGGVARLLFIRASQREHTSVRKVHAQKKQEICTNRMSCRRCVRCPSVRPFVGLFPRQRILSYLNSLFQYKIKCVLILYKQFKRSDGKTVFTYGSRSHMIHGASDSARSTSSRHMFRVQSRHMTSDHSNSAV